MTWTTIEETELEGFSGLLLYVASQWSGFIPLFLFVFFMIVTVGSYFAMLRTRGFADFWGSWTVGGIVTTIIALTMSMVSQNVDGTIYQLVNGTTIAICVTITIIGVVLLFTSQERD